MKVFGIGLSKTGITTLSGCLQTLGHRHLSMRLDLLEAYRAGRLNEVMSEIDKYESFEAWPYPLMYRELDEHYGEEAKFILTLRKNPETWLRSLENHSMHTSPTTHPRKIIYGYNYPHYRRQHHIDFYNRHRDRIQEYFSNKPGRLLTVCWENGDGWSKLCPFLGAPMREGPVTAYNVSSKRPRSGHELTNRALMLSYGLASILPGTTRFI